MSSIIEATCRYCGKRMVTGHRIVTVETRFGPISPVHGFLCADKLLAEIGEPVRNNSFTVPAAPAHFVDGRYRAPLTIAPAPMNPDRPR